MFRRLARAKIMIKDSHSQLSYLAVPWKSLHPVLCCCHQFFPAAEIHTGIVLVAHPAILQKIEQVLPAMAYSGMHPEKAANHIWGNILLMYKKRSLFTRISWTVKDCNLTETQCMDHESLITCLWIISNRKSGERLRQSIWPSLRVLFVAFSWSITLWGGRRAGPLTR